MRFLGSGAIRATLHIDVERGTLSARRIVVERRTLSRLGLNTYARGSSNKQTSRCARRLQINISEDVMKVVRTAALAVALMAGASATLAAQVSRDSSGRDTVRSEGRRGRGPMARGLFRGIELTESQRQQLRAIHSKYEPQRKEMRTAMHGVRESGQRPDSVTVQRWRDLMTRERNEIRGILTAEQRIVFDRNVEAVGDRMRDRGGKRGARRAPGERRGFDRRLS